MVQAPSANDSHLPKRQRSRSLPTATDATVRLPALFETPHRQPTHVPRLPRLFPGSKSAHSAKTAKGTNRKHGLRATLPLQTQQMRAASLRSTASRTTKRDTLATVFAKKMGRRRARARCRCRSGANVVATLDSLAPNERGATRRTVRQLRRCRKTLLCATRTRVRAVGQSATRKRPRHRSVSAPWRK
jgi:hypothetical protein